LEHFRQASPHDHATIVVLVDGWWGRPISGGLPRLFLNHFFDTSFVAEDGGEIVGFLVGFLSPSAEDEAYIHFVGVHPDRRRSGLARRMYEQFFDLARRNDRSVVTAVTASINESSIAFHRRMGFSVTDPIEGYNGVGTTMVLFRIGL
jgi:ribosomal protein S18 acetylase RimI-like enzyme